MVHDDRVGGPRPPVPVHFVVLPDVYLLDLAGVADALRTANRVAGRDVFAIAYHGVGTSAATSLGLPLSLPGDRCRRTLVDGALSS